MTVRNLSPQVFFEQLAARHRPRHVFTGTTKAAFRKWQRSLRPRVLATLGKAPTRVPPRPQLLVEWEEEDLVKQRWEIDVQPGLAAIVIVYRPAGLRRGERRPAILCCHGHGAHGKDPVMGLETTAGVADDIREHNYDYGRQMAHAGFVTYALDWLGFGERDARAKPFEYEGYDRRDPCNVHFLCATMMGTTVLAMNCHDGSRATDLVCKLPFVDAARLGVMGLSLGGTMTTWMMLTDRRFKAADNMCYAGPFHDIAFRTYNVCGSQVTPGLFGLCDLPHLHGLIAPRPLLMEIGIHDTCFEVDHTLAGHFTEVERIYAAAGAPDCLELDLFPGRHRWNGDRSVEFFRRHLRWPGPA